jgi:hypothetical protein
MQEAVSDDFTHLLAKSIGTIHFAPIDHVLISRPMWERILVEWKGPQARYYRRMRRQVERPVRHSTTRRRY